MGCAQDSAKDLVLTGSLLLLASVNNGRQIIFILFMLGVCVALKIAFTGYGRAGKDEAAMGLPVWSAVVPMAKPIKAAVEALFPHVDFKAYGRDDVIPEIGLTSRQLWQRMWRSFLGGGVSASVFVDAALAEFQALEAERAVSVMAITDLRRPFDGELLRQHGFVIIKITNPNLDLSEPWRQDETERMVDLVRFDHEIENSGSIPELHAKVRNLITEIGHG